MGVFLYSAACLGGGTGFGGPQKAPLSPTMPYQPMPPDVQARRNGGRTRRKPTPLSHLQPLTRATCVASTTRPWSRGSACWGAPTPSQVARLAVGGCARGRCACVPMPQLLGEGLSWPRCLMHPSGSGLGPAGGTSSGSVAILVAHWVLSIGRSPAGGAGGGTRWGQPAPLCP